MRILDQQRYWAFTKAYVVCFVSFVGLYIVIDAFSNFDEFLNVTRETTQLFKVIGRFYLVRSTAIYDRLCGVISMMAAVFTVTWMQRDNELIAMLAAGVSTQRIIRPVLISAVVVNLLAVANQEYIIPRFADELQKSHGDDGDKKVVMLAHRRDHNDIVILGREGLRKSKVITKFSATLPAGHHGQIEAELARYVGPEETSRPLSGGWLLRNARIAPADTVIDREVLVPVDAATLAQMPLTNEGGAEPRGAAYFLKTNVSFEALTRRRDWYVYGSTSELFGAMNDPVNVTERSEMEIYLHTRMIRPMLAMALMFVSLPFVLGGVGRNMFANLGMSLGTSAAFYAIGFLAQYLAANGILSATQAAWGPFILFGTVAAARWDSIRT